MLIALYRWIAAQPAEELDRQMKVLSALEPARLILTTVAYLVAALYVSFWLCLGLAAIDAAAKIQGWTWMRGLVPVARPGAYLGTLAMCSVTELCFCLPAAIAWQQENSFARSLALGLVAMSVAQQVTMRCVHLPFGIAGWATALAVSFVANSLVWLDHGDVAGFTISTLLIVAAGWLSLRFLLANHHIHDVMARDRLAARSADKAKSLFLTQMSHELRTPLNAIIGMGAAEMNKAGEPETRQRMATLVSSARGLATILDEILNFAAAEEGRLAIRPTALDLAGEVEAIVGLFRSLAEDQGMWISLLVGAAVPALVWLDRQRLRQCLTNLLSNALRHAGVGEIRVVLEAQGDQGWVTVGDRGRGSRPSCPSGCSSLSSRGPGRGQARGSGSRMRAGLPGRWAATWCWYPERRARRSG